MATPTTFGIEYSFVPKTDLPPDVLSFGSDTRVEDLADRLKDTGFPSAHEDGRALEVPSPVHRSLRSAKTFYESLIRRVRPRSMVAQRVDIDEDGTEQYFGTGGGHIHVGLFGRKISTYNESKDMKERDYLIVRNLLVMVANRPWLGWVFNEFMDNWNARAITGRGELTRLLAKRKRELPTNRRVVDNYNESTGRYVSQVIEENRFTIAFNKMRGMLGKRFAVNISRPDSDYTLEFRFFDAPRSWPQVQEHVSFVMALYAYAKKAAEDGRWLKLEQRGLDAVRNFRDRGKVEKDFKRTCRLLGLNWDTYSKYMKNYDDRAEFGSLT